MDALVTGPVFFAAVVVVLLLVTYTGDCNGYMYVETEKHTD